MFRTFLAILLMAAPAFAQGEGARGEDPDKGPYYFRSFVVERGESVADAVCLMCSITVRGEVREDAVAVGGSIVVEENASVGQDAVAVAGDISVAAGASIGQEAVVVAGRMHAAPGSSVAKAEVQRMRVVDWLPPQLRAASLLASIHAVLLLCFGLLAYLVMRSKRVASAAAAVQRWPVRTLLAGVAFLFLGIALLGITELIPRWGDTISDVLLFVLYAALGCGYAAVGAVAGARMLPGRGMALTAIFGMLVLTGLHFVPALNIVVAPLTLVACGGAVLLGRYGARVQQAR